ncbi:MAG: 23S rRNA (uracil(1939)-C(5))-methyltransferase RlmD [Bacillota bacterium]|nr:MAG: 23S rRNA (uracil(1939)-C(5))-methyltransferase RlmD [Bacillota bacterium]
MLTVGDIIIGKAIDVDYEGQGVIKHEGYVIFVKGLLLHEEAKIKITHIKKNFGQGVFLELITQSKDRFIHPQTILGSCNLLHMDKHEQLFWQHKITQETLKKIMHEDIIVESTITDGKDMHYRNKSVFHVMDKPYLSLGLYHYHDMKLVEVSQFILADEKTNEILNYLNFNKVIIDPKTLKHVVIRTNPKGEALITLVAKSSKFTGLEKLIQHLIKLKNIKGITLNISTSDNEILGDKSYTLYGENLLSEPIGDKHIFINDRSFFQINLPVISKVYDIIKKHIRKDSIVIDAYSGVGSIGYYVIDKLKKLILIESNKDSISMAKLTQETYQLNNVEIVQGRAEHLVKDYQADVLIVDPPRNGLMPELLDILNKTLFKQIFYLSCDAKTLARDLNTLKEVYHIDKVYPIRMFYHTTSLETLVILSKK